MRKTEPWFKCYPSRLLGALAGMNASEQLVYQIVLLRIYENDDGCCQDDIATLVRRTKLSNRAVAEALESLASSRRLYRDDKGFWRNPIADRFTEKIKEIRILESTGGKTGAQRRWQKEKANQQNGNGVAIARPKGPHPTRDSPSLPLGDSLGLKVVSEERASGRTIWDFDQFWRQYPHKVGKGAARRAFDAAMKKKGTTFPDLMLGLARYAAKTDDRPWCNPATWLNQERWLDEPAAQGGVNGGGKREGSLLDAFERISGALDEAEAHTMRNGPVRQLPAGPVR